MRVAEYLNLPNPETYNGRGLRSSSDPVPNPSKTTRVRISNMKKNTEVALDLVDQLSIAKIESLAETSSNDTCVKLKCLVYKLFRENITLFR